MSFIDRFDGCACGVCARRATGIGVNAPCQTRHIMWLCDDPECIRIARNTINMKQDQFTRLESLAASRGGEEGGAFLDSIGKTDLAQLTQAEWFEFCRRIVAGYRKALKDDLKNETGK